MTGSTYHSLDEVNRELALDMDDLSTDPLEWVRYSYRWGEGELEGHDGPDVWQEGFLREWGEEIRIRDFDGFNPVMPYFTSTTSGHGVGKSALTGMISGFILSTRPHSRGRVTANSIPQLQTTTWQEIAKWCGLMITSHWFRITSGRGALKVVHRKHDDWRIDGLAWDASRPAAFAGLHAASSSPWYLIDEASEVAQIILETAQGALTDGEPFFFMFSNPTMPNGFFYESHHGQMRKRFKTYKIDSRTAKMTNKELIQQWIEDYGIGSDFVKVRVLGEFPMTGDRQFIPGHLVDAAADPERKHAFVASDPVIVGVDVARFGGDESTIYIRRGRDARVHEARIFREIDNFQLSMEIKKIAEELLPDAINIDSGGGTGVIDNLVNWGIPNVNEIHFGGVSPDAEYDNMATYMMGMAREWLKTANACIPVDDKVLHRQLKAREYKMVQGKNKTAVRVESKDELKAAAEKGLGKESPDRADGFCLTFAVPVAVRDVKKTRAELTGETDIGVVGLDYDRGGSDDDDDD